MARQRHFAAKRTLDELDNCELTWGRFNQFQRHSHEGVMLSLIDAGIQPIDYYGKQYCAPGGTVVAVAPQESHASQGSRNEWVFRSVVVPLPLSQRLTGDVNSQYRCQLTINNPTMVQYLDEFFQAAGEDNVLAMEVSLTEVLTLLFSQYRQQKMQVSESGKEFQAVNKARDYLAAHPNNKVTLGELAHAAGMDSFHLCRAFSKHFGLPPHAWHKQFRLRQAQAKLVCGKSIADVALEFGFTDQAHFANAFKKLTGVTPASLVLQQQNGKVITSLL